MKRQTADTKCAAKQINKLANRVAVVLLAVYRQDQGPGPVGGGVRGHLVVIKTGAAEHRV